ncbi:DNase1 protein [Rutstroemia sp. NJR-2017a BVV2]|nr:DNase1 protein [Rutstroemia sp. NJR-2017a BVV2]
MFSFCIIFLPLLLLLTSTATATNTLTFHNLFSTPRLLQFVPVPASYAIPKRLIPAHSSFSISTPLWNGLFKAVAPDTSEHGPETTVIGEVCFDCWQGITFFDVSAIWNCCDNSGVHWMGSVEPSASGKGVQELWNQASAKGEISGCRTFPCDGVYNLPDDEQTKSTREDEIMVVLGP